MRSFLSKILSLYGRSIWATIFVFGEGLETLILSLLLPFHVGEGGWEGEVCRTDVSLGLGVGRVLIWINR